LRRQKKGPAKNESTFSIFETKMNPAMLGLILLLGLGGLIGGGTAKNRAKADEYTPKPSPTPSPTPQPNFGRLSYYLPTGNQTATGTTPVSGYSAAISRELLPQIPMGTLIKLPNGRIVRVEDLTGQDIKNTLDLFYSSREQANYPEQGLMQNVPYENVGRDISGLKYNF
jgi:3D (Asp-Asp-Asp) domain-containing protein